MYVVRRLIRGSYEKCPTDRRACREYGQPPRFRGAFHRAVLLAKELNRRDVQLSNQLAVRLDLEPRRET